MYRVLFSLFHIDQPVNLFAYSSETYVKVANQDLVSREIVSNDETRYQWIHNPVEHSNTLFDDRLQISVEMNGHHSLA